MLSGRVALVTGSSAGLGERFARVLDDAGATVVLTARRTDRLEQIAADLHDASWLAGDIADPLHRVALMQMVKERHGRLDILVNNAGTNDNGPSRTRRRSTSVIDVNLVAMMISAVSPHRCCSCPSRRSVVNLGSMYGIVGSRGLMAAYNATKGAVVNFSRHLAAQWGSRGVRVNTLAPGYFPSEMTGDLAGGFGVLHRPAHSVV